MILKSVMAKMLEAVMYATATQDGKESVLEDYVNKSFAEEQFEKLAEKKDACYPRSKQDTKFGPCLRLVPSTVQKKRC